MNSIEIAAVALEAASRVHQKVAAGASAGGQAYVRGDVKVDRSLDRHVLETADNFYDWLVSKS